MRLNYVTLLALASALGLGACAGDTDSATSAGGSAAEYVFTNAKVYTVDEARPWAEAVAAKGKEIVYVGDSAGAAAYVGADTESIDLGGKMLLPGFVDAHFHPVAGGAIMRGVDLQSDDVGEILSRIREYAEANPDLDVVQGYGVRFNPWNGEWPDTAMLDEIESERPVLIWTIDGHAGWANSKALEIASVTKHTPDPAPGFSFFERDAEGNPTGWIMEVPAVLQVLRALVEIDPDYMAEGVALWLPRFAAAGITSLQDLGLGGLPAEEFYPIYTELEQAGELPIRIQGVYYWNNKEIDPVPEIQNLRQLFQGELFKATHLKINMDGGDDKWNALYVDAYSDKPELQVEPIIPYDVVNDAVHRADALGIDTACHCFGDLAVRKMLDAIELATESNPPRDRRHIITHASLVHPDDRARFAELGAIWDSTGAWMSMDPLLSEVSVLRLGPERVASAFPMNAIHDVGGATSFGSDWPVSGYISEYRPLMTIQVAATRQLPGREHVPPLGGEAARVPLDRAIRAHTMGSAYAIGIDDIVGSIEVGKRADLVVLGENLFDIELHEVGSTDVLLTMMNGKVTHRDGI